MDWIQTLTENGTAPAFTAFLLGILTAISPCPLATNIAAVGYIGKNIGSGRKVFMSGLYYTSGRILSYTLLGAVLITVIREGSGIFGLQKTIGEWGETAVGPLMILTGAVLLAGDRIRIPVKGFRTNAESLATKGNWGALLIGAIFALAFCPTSGLFYFGILIPIAATAPAGYLLPVIYAAATAIPVIAVSWITAFSINRIGSFYGKMGTVQKWMNPATGILFIAIGSYYCAVTIL